MSIIWDLVRDEDIGFWCVIESVVLLGCRCEDFDFGGCYLCILNEDMVYVCLFFFEIRLWVID